MTFYTSIIILTELLMLAMTIHVINYSGFTKTQRLWYILTFLTTMFCAGAEYAVHCGYYNPSLKIILTILTVMQFSAAPLLGVLFIGALGLTKHAKYVSLIFVLHALIEIVLAPFGLIFYFNDEGYFRGNLFFIYEVFYFISLVHLIIGMFVVGKKFKHRDQWTIIMVLVILVAGIVPMTIFKLNITYMAIAICSSLSYIYYNDLVQEDIKEELVTNQQKMSVMQEHMIFGLASLIETRDMETGEHIHRTSAYVRMIAENARKEGIYDDVIDDEFITRMYTLAPMHDIGKIMVSDTILKKPGRLTPEEYEEMKKHASVGGEAIRKALSGVTDENYLQFASDIATYHHERWDGTGYPSGLKGENIPLSARIMAIADVYDALISERCYKSAMSKEEALKTIEEESGSHFDPKLVKVFLNHTNELEITE